MNTFAKPNSPPEPVNVRVTRKMLSVDLADGRTISVPLQWFPRLFHGTPREWTNFCLSYEGIHWEDLNEDISVESLLRGEKSGESQKSIQRWLGYRARGEREPIPELAVPASIAKELEKIWAAEEKKKLKPRARRAG